MPDFGEYNDFLEPPAKKKQSFGEYEQFLEVKAKPPRAGKKNEPTKEDIAKIEARYSDFSLLVRNVAKNPTPEGKKKVQDYLKRVQPEHSSMEYVEKLLSDISGYSGGPVRISTAVADEPSAAAPVTATGGISSTQLKRMSSKEAISPTFEELARQRTEEEEERYKEMSPGDVVFEGAKNLFPSMANLGANMIQGFVSTISHPEVTSDLAVKAFIGLAQKGLPNKAITGPLGQQSEEIADVFLQYLKKQYATEAGIKKYLATDPAGALSDLATVGTLVGAGIRGPALLSKASKILQAADGIGSKIIRASTFLEPTTLPIEVLRRMTKNRLIAIYSEGVDRLKIVTRNLYDQDFPKPGQNFTKTLRDLYEYGLKRGWLDTTDDVQKMADLNASIAKDIEKLELAAPATATVDDFLPIVRERMLKKLKQGAEQSVGTYEQDIAALDKHLADYWKMHSSLKQTGTRRFTELTREPTTVMTESVTEVPTTVGKDLSMGQTAKLMKSLDAMKAPKGSVKADVFSALKSRLEKDFADPSVNKVQMWQAISDVRTQLKEKFKKTRLGSIGKATKEMDGILDDFAEQFSKPGKPTKITKFEPTEGEVIAGAEREAPIMEMVPDVLSARDIDRMQQSAKKIYRQTYNKPQFEQNPRVHISFSKTLSNVFEEWLLENVKGLPKKREIQRPVIELLDAFKENTLTLREREVFEVVDFAKRTGSEALFVLTLGVLGTPKVKARAARLMYAIENNKILLDPKTKAFLLGLQQLGKMDQSRDQLDASTRQILMEAEQQKTGPIDIQPSGIDKAAGAARGLKKAGGIGLDYLYEYGREEQAK